MAVSIGTAFHKFGQKVSAGARRFGQKLERGISKGVDFAKKALPAIEKVAGQVAGGIARATPLIAGIAPEFAPLALGAAGLAKGVQKAASGGRMAIGRGEQLVSQIKTGDTRGAIQTGQGLRRDLRI